MLYFIGYTGNLPTVRYKLENIAIIDLGSNSARLVLAHILDNAYFVVYDELKETVRLAQDMERDGFLKPARIEQAIKTLKMFRRLCDASGTERIYAFATNAVRRAKNQKSFLEEVNAVCGFKLKVLTEEEETTMIYTGVINSLEIPKGVIVDISGSSVQLIQYNRRNIINYANLPFGTITLTSLFADAETNEQQATMIENYVKDQFLQIEWLKEIEPDYQMVGVGGSFRNVAKIVKRLSQYPLEMIHNYPIEAPSFDTVYNNIKLIDLDKRSRIKGLSSARADIFTAALSCIKGFMDTTKFDRFTVSGAGIREGCLFNKAMPSTEEKPISDILGYSITTKLKYYGLNVKHAENVCAIAAMLYKQLRVLHKLPRPYAKVLRVAAMLNDSGMHINYYDHCKHSQYVILHSNLYGLSHHDLILAAFVTGVDHLDDFNMQEWKRYKNVLNDEDAMAVMKLSVILRIASSLDRAMSGSVQAITCDILGDSVIMKTQVDGDCSLEIKDALTAGSDFAKVFKKNLEIL